MENYNNSAQISDLSKILLQNANSPKTIEVGLEKNQGFASQLNPLGSYAQQVQQEKSDDLLGSVCGCGRPAKYTSFIDNKFVGSCNKYGRCPTYEELEYKLKQLKAEFDSLLCSANDTINYRESTNFYKEAEINIRRFNK